MSADEKSHNIDIQFQNKLGDIGDMEEKLRGEAEVRLRKLARGSTDIVGASIINEQDDKEPCTPHRFRARIVAYTRPDDIIAVEVADTSQAAMKGALDALERQVREKREKLRERWKNS